MFSILQWNMNGFYNNYHELQLLVQSLSPSIILLNETHLAYNVNAFHTKRYFSIFHNLPLITSSKQGVAILIKKNLQFKRIAIQSTISAIGIEIDLNFKLNIICAYIPPTQSFSNADILHLLQQVTAPVILAGDLNAWSPLWGSPLTNNRGKHLEDALITSDLVCLNNGSATHFSTHGTFSHLDLTLCSAPLVPLCTWSTLNDLHGSDHYPIVCKVNMQLRSKFKPKCIYKTDYADWSKFSDLCEKANTNIPASVNTNREAALIQKIIRSAANLSVPRTNSVKPSRNVPWWNSNLASLRSRKQSTWYEYKRCQTLENLVAYKRSNALFRRTAKEAKRQCFQNFTANINPSSSPKKIWNDINILSGGPKNTLISQLNTSAGPLGTPDQISNYFASHFANASADKNFSSQFRNSKALTLGNFPLIAHNLSRSAKLIESEISLSEFEYALSSVKGKTPGLDKISYPLIKNLPNSIKVRLTKLYNNILDTGIYPQSWKTSNIVPILKSGKPSTDVNSYRPISLLSCLGKILEKIIGNRLAWYAKRNNLISSRQVAYQKGHGTIDALLSLDNFVTNALSSKSHVSLLSLDFQKAFDRIGIHVVLKQLQKWKVGPKMLNFLKSFLTNRKLSVSVNGSLSSTCNLSNGTPQGSPLSAFLFIIAFDELSHLLCKYKNIEHQIYADDVLIYTKANNISSVENIFTDILNDISLWSITSGVKLSLEKTNLLHICRKRSPCNISLRIDNYAIQPKENLMLLGLIIDSKYSFKPHCNYIRNSLANRLNIIKYLSCKHSYIHPTTLINVVRALLLSKIDYALPIYGHCATSLIRKISVPYHAAIRRSLRAFPTSPIKFLLAEAGLPSIPNRVTDATSRVLAKQLDTTNMALTNIFNNAILRKTQPRIPSSISRSLVFAKENFITLYRAKRVVETFPPWLISPRSFEDVLLSLSKQNTPNTVYRATFSETFECYRTSGWNFIFTDGSKTSDYTSLAVINQDGAAISQWLLYPMCTIFTAEALAIELAVEYAKKKQREIYDLF